MYKKIKDILFEIEENTEDYEGNDFLDDGILDSIQLLDLVSELEAVFEIEIPAAEMVRENFKTVDSILAMLQCLVNQG